jgi:hypothetical protein
MPFSFDITLLLVTWLLMVGIKHLCCLIPGRSTSTLLRDSRNENLVSRTKHLGLYDDIRTIPRPVTVSLTGRSESQVISISRFWDPSWYVFVVSSGRWKPISLFTSFIPIPDVAYDNTYSQSLHTLCGKTSNFHTSWNSLLRNRLF